MLLVINIKIDLITVREYEMNFLRLLKLFLPSVTDYVFIDIGIL